MDWAVCWWAKGRVGFGPGSGCGDRPGAWDQLRQLSEVLSDSGEEELVFGAAGSAQPLAAEAKDALEVREEHLDFPTLPPRGAIGLGLTFKTPPIVLDGAMHGAAFHT